MVNDRVRRRTAQITFYIMLSLLDARCARPRGNTRIKREKEPMNERLTVYCSMRFPKMAKFTIVVAIVVLASVGSQSQRIIRETATEVPDANIAAIRDILQKISSGESNAKDDEKLVEIIKDVIVRTAEEVKMPAGSIDVAAKKAQILVSELTSAYTNAIYKSNSFVDARENFARFQTTVQTIVDFIKNGKFLIDLQ
ncbi:uncharacterized protein LOC114933537 [Nylanderia fulva]|uniref:uncharacterized protein LOC114933537 n=1 Tax=Nylanderia fulva TaxID=613905 RepID=UPI0010FB804C|nr:uncharacterized protein LOC114933537 [Nylanderia fulva]